MSRARIPVGGDMGWHAHAACVGMDTHLFFAEDFEQLDEARKVCFACPVREDCAEFALANNEDDGMWGGYTARQRRKIRKLRKAAA